MFLASYIARNFIKEKIGQIYAACEYPVLHPYTTIRKQSHDSTVEFIQKNCLRATPCRTPRRLMDIALDHVKHDGAFLEFGVFKGSSINYIARKNPQRQIHGFDSFEGLQESWVSNPKNAFSLGGKMPKARGNVQLSKGFFDTTLPIWAREHGDKVAFLHIDCDLYSSTKTIFDALRDRMQVGTVILFDDYFNFTNWEQDGHRVWVDFQRETGVEFEYLGYAYKELAVRITAIG